MVEWRKCSALTLGAYKPSTHSIHFLLTHTRMCLLHYNKCSFNCPRKRSKHNTHQLHAHCKRRYCTKKKFVLIKTRSFFQEIVLRPASRTFKWWKQPPVNPLMKVYIYNVTNADEFLIDGAKPIVEELGPYVYR